MRIAVIPARGGSKRIPAKNIVGFHGRPIIAWSIEAALQSGCFDDVVVSTDSEEIAEIARRYGASIPFMRPARLSDDHTGTTPVVKHALEWFLEHGHEVTEACCIYATAPFIDGQEIREGLKVLQANECDYVFTATTFSYPIQRALQVDSAQRVRMFNPEYAHSRSQDLPAAWHDAAQFYWGKASSWRQEKKLFESDSRILPIPKMRVHDIDTPEDLERVEAMFTAALAQNAEFVAGAAFPTLVESGATGKLSLGTVQFGMDYGVANDRGRISRDKAGAVLKLARKSGLRALDTAIGYGESEDVLGQLGTTGWEVTTKLPAVPEATLDIYQWVAGQVRASLDRLSLPKVHAVLLHRPDQLLGVRGPELQAALHRLKTDGLTSKIGISVYTPSELERLFATGQFDLVQAPCSIIDQRLVHSGWVQRLRESGIELHTRSIFLQGLLLMNEEQRPAKFRRWPQVWSAWSTWLKETGLEAVEACLLYALSIAGADRVVVGVDGVSHLQAILDTKCRHLPSLPEWPDPLPEDLLDPSRWSAL
jgi:pseudaminic acid cytidylyltransferase